MRCRVLTSGCACGALLVAASAASADEGAAGVWLPGTFASFAAVPATPGFSLPLYYYYGDSSASASREFLVGGQLVAGIRVRSSLLFITPTWAKADALWGASAEFNLGWAVGRVDVDVSAVVSRCTGTQCPPALHGSQSSTAWGGSDLYPTVALKWTHGQSNHMGYLMAGAPTGAYRLDRLSNIGLNHWAIDGGYGYTYLNEENGRELSGVAGLTYNFENPDTHYRSGLDSHLDLAVSQFLNEHWHVGIVGYAYYQLSADSGSGVPQRLGGFEGRVFALGPQAGYFFHLGGGEAYLSLRGYWEFGARNRPEGWSAYLTCDLPLTGR
jgi:hypothetical protein